MSEGEERKRTDEGKGHRMEAIEETGGCTTERGGIHDL